MKMNSRSEVMSSDSRSSKLPELGYVRSKLREVVTADYNSFIEHFRKTLKYFDECRYRSLVVLTGSDPIKLSGIASQIVLNYLKFKSKKDAEISILYVHHDEFEDSKLIGNILRKVLKNFAKNRSYHYNRLVYEVSEKVLGTTCQVLVMDLLHDLKPNDVGRLLGIVEGGGLIIFLTPPFDVWINMKTLFKNSLTVPKYPEPRHIFIKWFIDKLFEHEGIYIFDVDQGKLIKVPESVNRCSIVSREVKIHDKTIFSRELYELALTQDQVEVVKLIEENFIENPGKGRRVTLVVVADRGRGKSCAIGIGIVGLIMELLRFKNRVRVGVTARDSLSVQSLMNLANRSLRRLNIRFREIRRGDNLVEIKGDRFSIEYWHPADIIKLKLDVLIVDEAAGIPVPLLHRMWLSFKRTIFVTTIHGYEGAGRGFSVRFLGRVKEDKRTKLLMYEMREPIRYAVNDPIERFQFDVLLLDAEPDSLDERDMQCIEEKRYEYLKLTPEELFSKANEGLLRSLFGIYVLAHYRNEPDDLGMLADAPHHSIRAIRLETGKIVAAAQLAEEGGIPDEFIDDLLHGGKIAGNIIPDRLLKHLRRREFGKGLGWRIVRIAVHPSVQGRGIGSFLLKKVIEEAYERNYDWVGSGFGVNRELLNFWLKNGFKVLHISPDRNPVSGEYTVLVLYPLRSEWKDLTDHAVSEFIVKLTESLHDVYKDLEPDVAYLLLTQSSSMSFSNIYDLTKTQIERLKLYLLNVMTYETVCDAVSLLVKKAIYSGVFSQLTEDEGRIMISKVLQGNSWFTIAEIMGVDRSKTISRVREITSKLMNMVIKN